MSPIDNFKTLFKEATKCINCDYIQLPVAGQENKEYRERIYCYELYHQLRSSWPVELDGFSLAGELDKAGHQLIRNGNLDNVKPDFLVHVPASMENNLLVIEVKPVNMINRTLKKDLKTLTAFRKKANYDNAFHLSYGNQGVSDKEILQKAKSIQKNNPDEVDLNLIEFWRHSNPEKEVYNFN